MADLEKATATRLKEHAGVAALVGTRVWYDRLRQDPTLPAITVQEISAPRVGAMRNDADRVRARLQVDAWDDNRDGAKALAEQVRDALQRYAGTHEGTELLFVEMNSGGVKYESEGRIWRGRQDFGVWFTETV